MTRLLRLCELAIAVVDQHCALGAAGLDGLDCPLYGVNAQRRPQRIATGPLNERHTRLYKDNELAFATCTDVMDQAQYTAGAPTAM